MTQSTSKNLPHHNLIVYRRATELLTAVVESSVRDARLREQALKSAKSCCLNIAEAAGRWSQADRARIFQIARGECCEAAAAVELAGLTGEALADRATCVGLLAKEVFAMLTALIARRG